MTGTGKRITEEAVQKLIESLLGYTNGEFKSNLMQTLPDIPHHYSIDERLVGTWIDGKPLYEKTIYLSYEDACSTGTVYSNVYYYQHHIPDVDFIRIKEYTIIPTDDININNIISDEVGRVFGNFSDGAVGINTAVTTKSVYLYGSTTLQIKGYYFTLVYTKTTDDASIYDPNMIIDNTYSYNEHVVGRWVDGKPLYEKSIYLGEIYNNADIPIDPIDFDIVFSHAFVMMKDPKRAVIWPNDSGNYTIHSDHIEISNNNGSNSGDMYITLRYTKTTD